MSAPPRSQAETELEREELLGAGLAPIGIAGLDQTHNAVHRAIWEALASHRRPERAPVRFSLLSPAHEFLQSKIKRQTYETYVPKGLVKRSWIEKHTTLVPAVVVIFFDLEWNDPHWQERQLECTSRVQSFRLALEGRGTKVCVVLIQQRSPTGEDPLATERANALILSAELTTKSLFVLPSVDNINGYVMRLEKALFDLAISYYNCEIRSVKAHRDQLNKKTHQYLYVRHHFKMAFFCELKQDLTGALGHYGEAYSQLLEVRTTETNELEVKTVAGLIALRCCRTLFVLGRAKDALSQFKAHVEHFRHRPGSTQLLFEHYAWLSAQYRLFGDLFSEMVQHHNVPAGQTQHPGHYYRLAAKHASNRKITSMQACPVDLEYPDPDPLTGDTPEFLGQRPWRPCLLSAEPLDTEAERRGIAALQWVERHKVNHPALIISLLGNAISQFKTYRCPRMRRQLVVKMADEYYAAKDYGKALTLVTHMLWDYRAEGWTAIVDSLLRIALRCAYLTAAASDYAALCVEACARFKGTPLAAAALSNLMTIAKGEAPNPEEGIEVPEAASASGAWARVGSGPLTVDMSAVNSPLQCKASITLAEYDCVQVRVLIRSELEGPLEIGEVTVLVGLASGSREAVCEPVNSSESLEAGGLGEWTARLVPSTSDVAKAASIIDVTVALPTNRVLLKFFGQPPEHAYKYPELLHFRVKSGNAEEERFSSAPWEPSKVVGRRTALVSVEDTFDAPALTAEWLPITLALVSAHTTTASALRLTLSCPSTDSIVEVKRDGEVVALPAEWALGSLDAGGQLSLPLHARSATCGPRSLCIQVLYKVDEDECLAEKEIKWDVVEAFSLSTKILGRGGQEMATVYSREMFTLQAEVTAVSPHPLRVHSVTFNMSDGVRLECDPAGFKSGQVASGQTVTCSAKFVASRHSDKPVRLASLRLLWSRLGDATAEADGGDRVSFADGEWWSSIEETPVTVQVEPPACSESGPPAESCLSAHPRVRVPLPLAFLLTNHTGLLLTFQLFVEASDSFMFSGDKQVAVSVAPGETRAVRYSLCPLVSGEAVLPKLTLSPLTPAVAAHTVAAALERALPPSLFVLPPKRTVSAKDAALPVVIV